MLYSFCAKGLSRLRPRRAAKWLAAASLVAALGCASGSLSKIENTGELPKELPKELAQKFEVKEAPSTPAPLGAWPTGPAVIAHDDAVAGGKRAKRKKKHRSRKGQEPPAEVAVPFAYPSRRPAKDPLAVGEQMTYSISYLGMTAGNFKLEVLPFKEIDNRKVYHVKGQAESSGLFSAIYRLNDMVESFFDFDGLFSHRFHIVLDESKQQRDALELYDSEKKQTFYWNRWSRKNQPFVETKDFQPIEPFSQDSLSALYYLRMIPLPPGAVVTFPVVSEGKGWEAVVTVVRREEVDSPLGKVQAVVVKPETRFQGVLQKKGDSYLWLTDDDRRIVLRLDAKVRIGTVVARLTQYQPGAPAPSP